MEHHEHYFTMQQIPMQAACNPLLTPSEKLTFASIYFIQEASKSGCFASDEYLADYNQLSIVSVRKNLKKLEALKYIKRETKTTIVREARGTLPTKYNRRRTIHVEIHPLWEALMDIWNWAFPQKDEEAKNYWWELKQALLEYHRSTKNVKINEIQDIWADIGGSYTNIYVGHFNLHREYQYSFIGILKKCYYKSSIKNKKNINKKNDPPNHKEGHTNSSSFLDLFPDEWKEDKTFQDIVEQFEQHRKEIKKKLTKTAQTRLVNKLKSFPKETVISSLELSIENGWTGVFPENNKNKSSNQNKPSHSGKPGEENLRPEDDPACFEFYSNYNPNL